MAAARGVLRPGRPLHWLLAVLPALLILTSSLAAVDYCIDQSAGSDASSGLCPDQAWASFAPTWNFPFQSGDRVMIAPGRYVYLEPSDPRSAWYMLPGVSWIGSGAEQTEVIFRVFSTVPFVRFRTSSQGSGPPFDQRPGSFGPDTVLADLTLVNEGTASTAIDVRVSGAESSPTLRDLGMEGFPRGIELHPTSDERSDAATRAAVTRNLIRDADDIGIVSYADVFYARLVVEDSTLTNNMVRSAGEGISIRTFISYTNNFDPADAVAEPVLTNNTISAGAGSGAVLISYLDDGYGRFEAVDQQGGTLNPELTGNILTDSDRYGLEERTPWTEPLIFDDNCAGGNALADYLDEGDTPVPATSVGTGNLSAAAVLVDAPAGDLHQMAASPSVDRLPPASAPGDDIDGHSRPQGASSDMGADEYVACSAVADPSRSTTPAPCEGGSTILDGTASTVDAVCTAGLRYEWWRGATLLGTDPVMPYDPPADEIVTLRVVCADPALSACRDETDLPVGPTSPPVFADAGPDRTMALGESDPLGGAPTAWGGTPPFAYTWDPDPPELDTASNPANPDFSPAVAGPHPFTVTVTDDEGCTAQDQVTVTVVPSLTADAGPDRTIREDQTTDLGGSPSAAGGEAPYTYSWDPVAGLDDPTSANPTFTPATPGVFAFTLSVGDAGGRIAEDEVVVTVEAVPPLVADAGPDQSIELAATAVLGGSPAASGGVPPYGYSWAPIDDLDDPSLANPTFQPPSTGDFVFVLTVTDDRGVQAEDQVLVRVGTTPPLLADAGPDAVIDTTETWSLGGNPPASGGTAPYGFTWAPSIGLDDPAAGNPLFTPPGSGTYPFTLTVTDDAGEEATDGVTVTVVDPLVADAGPDRSIDLAGTTPLGGSPSASGGLEPYLYDWSPTAGLDDASSANPTFTPSAPGSFAFTLTVTDDRGVQAVDIVGVEVADLPPLAADAGVDRTITAAETTLLGGTPAASGGASPYTYAWDPAADLNDAGAEHPRFTPPGPGVYVFSLTATDSQSEVAMDEVTVTVEDVAPDTPPGEAHDVRVMNQCTAAVAITFTPAPLADRHRLYRGDLGDFANHENLASPEGCDDTTGPTDPDQPRLFRTSSSCGPGSFYFLVVGVNDVGEGTYGHQELDGDPGTQGPERPPGTPVCP